MKIEIRVNQVNDANVPVWRERDRERERERKCVRKRESDCGRER